MTGVNHHEKTCTMITENKHTVWHETKLFAIHYKLVGTYAVLGSAEVKSQVQHLSRTLSKLTSLSPSTIKCET